jgi:hypothetical protein
MQQQPREETGASTRPAIIMPRAGAVRLQFQPSARVRSLKWKIL